ncbi:MAG TPA: 30S ribosomal protein S20 [Rhodospirillales bacterium]|jgi:small subunit ribosomal protein S20|nr:30S ribosomal protein S20 [Pseudomonadota bacterium]HIM41597.1 30S ribosomal protein S20 [Rhodospirillales bacterium]HIN21277.1 30S ribosomal protein S20 [Rhodospirillales bacterium]
MAVSLSAKKRIRQTKRRTEVNIRRLNALRSSIRKVEAAITAGNKSAAEAALRVAEPQMMRGAGKGVVNRNTMSRKLSRLSRQIKRLAA